MKYAVEFIMRVFDDRTLWRKVQHLYHVGEIQKQIKIQNYNIQSLVYKDVFLYINEFKGIQKLSLSPFSFDYIIFCKPLLQCSDFSKIL